MRELLQEKVVEALEKKGFLVQTFFDSNSCFDLIAKKQKVSFLVKVFSNVDSFRRDHAIELRKLSEIFHSIPLIVGENSKAFDLEDGVLYERHSCSVMNLNSFVHFLQGEMPSKKYFKGKTLVELDEEKMHSQRIKKGLTLSELAEKTHLTAETLHRFEKGQSTSFESGKKLEKILGVPLLKQFSIESIAPEKVEDRELTDSVLEKIEELGARLSLFEHAIFDAVSPEKELLISKAGKGKDIDRKAFFLNKSREVFPSSSMVVAKSSPKAMSFNTPIIEESELESLKRFSDLMKLLKEKQLEGKKHGRES